MTNTSPPALTERQQFWLKHLRACEAEGKPTVEHAREHGPSPSAMHSARQDLVHKGVLPAPGKPRFTRAVVSSSRLQFPGIFFSLSPRSEFILPVM